MEMGRIQESLGAIWPWALSARGRRLTLLPGDPSPHAVGPCPPPCSSSFHELSQSLAFHSLAKPCHSQAGGDGAGSDEWHERRQGQCLDTAMSRSVFPALCLVPCWIPPSGCSPVPLSLHSARGQEGSQAALCVPEDGRFPLTCTAEGLVLDWEQTGNDWGTSLSVPDCASPAPHSQLGCCDKNSGL